MNDEKNKHLQRIKITLKWIRDILPFAERIGSGTPSKLLGFLKVFMVIVFMTILLICVPLWGWKSDIILLIAILLTTIIVLFAITVLTVGYITKLRIREGNIS